MVLSNSTDFHVLLRDSNDHWIVKRGETTGTVLIEQLGTTTAIRLSPHYELTSRRQSSDDLLTVNADAIFIAKADSEFHFEITV